MRKYLQMIWHTRTEKPSVLQSMGLQRVRHDWATEQQMMYKGLISNIHKQLIPFNNLITKWAQEVNRNFSKEEMQMANRRRKRCSTSLIIREMQIKITRTHHLTCVRMAVIKKNITNAGEDVQKRESSYTVCGNVNCGSQCRKQYGGFLKILK